MTELIQDEDWKASHRLDPNAYFVEIYRLLCHVLASPLIANVDNGPRNHLVNTSFQQSEISRLLIHVASYYRVKYDDGSWEHAKWLYDKCEGVGSLIEDLEKPDTIVKLPFREACNKIIHAKRVNFDVKSDTEETIGFLNPVVHLYGERRNVNWKASVDVIEFCKAAFNVIV